jgi:hypothetical protein
MNATLRRLIVGGSVAGMAFSAAVAAGTVAPGTPGKDVTKGLDNDNAANTFIQPPGVVAKQHMDNTDVLFGRDNDDYLQGNLGSDVLVAGEGDDILVGGPENFTSPNSDVLLGDKGNDINIWAPGDGSDAYVGDAGYDAMIFAPFVTKPNGSPVLEWFHGRRVPRVDISGQPTFTCDIVKVPAAEDLGAQFLVRFEVNGTPVVTVRQKDVEALFCPSPFNNRVAVADLTRAHPRFDLVRLPTIHGALGAILAKP